jgi:hypothetical protein
MPAPSPSAVWCGATVDSYELDGTATNADFSTSYTFHATTSFYPPGWAFPGRADQTGPYPLRVRLDGEWSSQTDSQVSDGGARALRCALS